MDKRCKVCKAVRTDKRLLKRIYESKQYREGGEPLTQIARDFVGSFTYEGLYNHCQRHQNISAEDLEKRRIVKRARDIEAAQIRKVLHHAEARQELVELGVKGIRKGEIKLTAASVVALLKQQSDIEEKDKDRQLQVIQMVQAFQAGELSYTDDLSIEEGEVVQSD